MKCTCPNCGFEFETAIPSDTPLGKARAELGLTLAKVTEAIGGGLSIRQLARLEKGQTMPELKFARKLAKVYGKSIDELWPAEEEESEDDESTADAEGEDDPRYGLDDEEA